MLLKQEGRLRVIDFLDFDNVGRTFKLKKEKEDQAKDFERLAADLGELKMTLKAMNALLILDHEKSKDDKKIAVDLGR